MHFDQREAARRCRDERLTARTGNTLARFCSSSGGLVCATSPHSRSLRALLDAQVAVGQRCHAPQRRRAIALDLQLERHDVAARQHHDLRRVFLVLVLLGAVGQSRLEHDLAAFEPEPEAQALRAARAARTACRRRSAATRCGACRSAGTRSRRRRRRSPTSRPAAPLLRAPAAAPPRSAASLLRPRGPRRARRPTSVAIETMTPMMTMTTRISSSVKPWAVWRRAEAQRSLRQPVAAVGVDAFAAFLVVGAEREQVVLAVRAGIDIVVVVAPRILASGRRCRDSRPASSCARSDRSAAGPAPSGPGRWSGT